MTVGLCDNFTVDETFAQIYEVPSLRSYFRLNEDGTFDDMPTTLPAVYIKDNQVDRLGDPEVVKFLRCTYGECVCVMHSLKVDTRLPVFKTNKFILGG